MRTARPMAALVAVALGACATDEPTPSPAPVTTLLVLETRPCNWLRPPDPSQCSAYRLVRIGLDGAPIADITPELGPSPDPAEPLPAVSRRVATSRDGERVAWSWNWELWVMPVDASAEPRLVTQPRLAETIGESVTEIAWSPDGTELVYEWWGAGHDPRWFVLDPDTGEEAELDLPVDCAGPAWSPVESTLACAVVHEADPDGRADLWFVDLEDASAGSVTEVGDEVDDIAPAWSPDGGSLAFLRLTSEPTGPEAPDGIWILDLETFEERILVRGTFGPPTWSPDGRGIAAYDERLGRIVIVDVATSAVRALDHDPQRYIQPMWLPPD